MGFLKKITQENANENFHKFCMGLGFNCYKNKRTFMIQTLNVSVEEMYNTTSNLSHALIGIVMDT